MWKASWKAARPGVWVAGAAAGKEGLRLRGVLGQRAGGRGARDGMGWQGGQRGVGQVEPVGEDLGQIGAGCGVAFQAFDDFVASVASLRLLTGLLTAWFMVSSVWRRVEERAFDVGREVNVGGWFGVGERLAVCGWNVSPDHTPALAPVGQPLVQVSGVRGMYPQSTNAVLIGSLSAAEMTSQASVGLGAATRIFTVAM